MQLPDFLIIPSILIRDEKLQPLDREIYGIIYWASNLDLGKCILSNKEIANLLDCYVTSVSHSLKRLHSGKYVEVIKNIPIGGRAEIIPLISFSRHAQMDKGVAQMDNRSIYNTNINKEYISIQDTNITTKKNKKPSSKNSVLPLTPMERWKIAKDLDVSLLSVETTEKSFWEYIKNPKGKRKGYKTSHGTIKAWVRMGIQRGDIRNCNETEKLHLDMQNPDVVEERRKVFEWTKKNKITE